MKTIIDYTCLILLFAVFCPVILRADSLGAHKVYVKKFDDGWKLIVAGKPYIVKGVCYELDKVGEDPGNATERDWMIVDDDKDGRIDVAYQSWVDKNLNNKKDPDEPETGDFQLLKEMGCNTIRIYHHATADTDIQAVDKNNPTVRLMYQHAPNKEVLRDLFNKYGIRVAMGDLLGAYTISTGATWQEGTDYTSPEQRKNMMASVENMVKEHKDEPYILMWILGNENNYSQFTHTNASKYPKEYAQFVNKAAKRIHQLDPGHPVCLCNGETQNIDKYKKYAPEVDIFGLNSYRNPGFGGLWKEVAAKYDKPVLLTEYGTGHPRVTHGVLDEDDQAKVHKKAWLDIYGHTAGNGSPGNAIGGFAFEWLDNWWEDGKPFEQNINPSGSGWNHEYNGIASQGDGSQSPLLRQLKKVYFMYKSIWNDKKNG